MKLAVVARPDHLGFTYVSAYQMALGHLLVQNEKYRNHYKELARQGHFIIVDNGAAEQKKVEWKGNEPQVVGYEAWLIKFEQIVEAAPWADEFILPDEKFESAITASLTMQHRHLVEPRKRMIVPQGKTEEEWWDCFYALHLNLDGKYASIGITKDYEALIEGGRPSILRDFARIIDVHHIHLLGVHGSRTVPTGVETEIELALSAYPGIRGIDTAAPLAFAQHDVSIEDHRTHFSYDWEMDFIDDPVAMKNIQTLQGWCNAHID